MEASVTIDPKSGNVSAGDFLITANLEPSRLPQTFSVGSERSITVLGKSVPCQFATAQIVDRGQTIRIDVRFENKVLVSCFFTFPGTAPDDEHRVCSRWLTSQLRPEERSVGKGGVSTCRSRWW